MKIARCDASHASQKFLHRPCDREGVEHGPQDHKHPDGDEDRNGHLPRQCGAGQSGFTGIHAQSQDAQVVAIAHQGDEDIRDLALGCEVLTDQGALRSCLQLGREFQPTCQPQIAAGIGGIAADRNAEVDNSLWIGEEDVAETRA